MIPSYLHDLALPNVFAQYTKQVESYLLESTKNEHIVDSEAHHICGFVKGTERSVYKALCSKIVRSL